MLLKKTWGAVVAAFVAACCFAPLTHAVAETPSTPITGITVTMTEPVLGETPDFTADVTTNEGDAALQSVYQVDWWEQEGETSHRMSATETFEFGKDYYFYVEKMFPADGYTLNSRTPITVNGEANTLYLSSDASRGFMVRKVFALAPTVVPSLSITVDAPLLGGTPDMTADVTTPYGDIVTTYRGEWWYRVEGGTRKMAADEVFQQGVTYWFIVMDPEFVTGYTINNTLTATVNGQAAGVTWYTTGSATVGINCELAVQSSPINSFSVAVDAPVVGSVPDMTAEISSPQGTVFKSGYTVEWWARHEGGTHKMAADEPFEEGGLYWFNVMGLTPAPGFWTDGTATADVNGDSAEFKRMSGLDGWTVVREYTLDSAASSQPVKRIALKLDAPVAGQQPDTTSEVVADPVGSVDEAGITVTWVRITPDGEVSLAPGEAFAAGESYRAYVGGINAATSFELAADMEVLINEAPATGMNIMGNTGTFFPFEAQVPQTQNPDPTPGDGQQPGGDQQPGDGQQQPGGDQQQPGGDQQGQPQQPTDQGQQGQSGNGEPQSQPQQPQKQPQTLVKTGDETSTLAAGALAAIGAASLSGAFVLRRRGTDN